MGCIPCLPQGTIPWDSIYEAVQPYAVFVSGFIFGLAWWIWGDALLYSIVVNHQSFWALTLIPGLIATLAVMLMNFISREDLDHEYLDEAGTMRAKLLLFVSYLLSLGAIAGAVVLLIQSKQGGKDMWVGASGVIQCCMVLASGMICWFFHASDQGSLGYGYL